MLNACALKAINWYQRKGGSRHFFGIECNFEPTCSEYTKQSIQKYGLLSGIRRGWRRICICNRSDVICKCIDPVTEE
jgi:putative component of membrane protein insertase Oxa1/YidC/SpoIIIJ protein YidD